jgi:tetratricopeptide (TPR) repeat protein
MSTVLSIHLLASVVLGADVRTRFDEAQAAYDLGRFEQASQLYGEAYELSPLPAFLFNIAQCQRKLGHWGRAAFFYRRFLARAPEGGEGEDGAGEARSAGAAAAAGGAGHARAARAALQGGVDVGGSGCGDAHRARAGRGHRVCGCPLNRVLCPEAWALRPSS